MSNDLVVYFVPNQAQHERADNCALRADNDKIRCENIAIREALKNVICPSCGGPPLNDDSYFNDHKLRLENAHLKEEVNFVSSKTCLFLFYSFLMVNNLICSLIECLALLPSTLEDQFPNSRRSSLFIYRLWTYQWRVLETKGWLVLLLLPLILIFFLLQGLPHHPCLIIPLAFRTWTSPSCQTLLPMPWKNF